MQMLRHRRSVRGANLGELLKQGPGKDSKQSLHPLLLLLVFHLEVGGNGSSGFTILGWMAAWSDPCPSAGTRALAWGTVSIWGMAGGQSHRAGRISLCSQDLGRAGAAKAKGTGPGGPWGKVRVRPCRGDAKGDPGWICVCEAGWRGTVAITCWGHETQQLREGPEGASLAAAASACPGWLQGRAVPWDSPHPQNLSL